jgi:predicted polyphosphate/ATP-dependent NAD kinase
LVERRALGFAEISMKWAFIYTLDDPTAEPRIDVVGSLVCAGVSSVADAPAVARQLVAEGVELIELCGGFGGTGLGLVTSAVKNRVPVGAVFFGVDASAALHRLFPGAKGDD